MAEFLALFDNLWFALNAVEGVIFIVLAVLFKLQPERAGFLISNYRTFSKERKSRYDMKGMSGHLAKIFVLCGALCLIGALAAIKFDALAYWSVTVVWFAIVVANLRMDNEKLLKKYYKG